MADTLKVYKGVDVVGTAERGEDGKAKVTIDGLDANRSEEHTSELQSPS